MMGGDGILINEPLYIVVLNDLNWLLMEIVGSSSLLQAMLNPNYRKRPIAEAVINHRFFTGAVL